MAKKYTKFKVLDELLSSHGFSRFNGTIKKISQGKAKLGEDLDLDDIIFGKNGIYVLLPDGSYQSVAIHISYIETYQLKRKHNSNKKFDELDTTSLEVISHLHRFHVLNCETLRRAKKEGWHKKFVCAGRSDGLFFYQFMSENKVLKKVENQPLNFCQNCFKELKTESPEIFSKKEYAEWKCPDILEHIKNKIKKSDYVDSTLAPSNVYPDDWEKISRRLKEIVSYQCQNSSCKSPDLSKSNLRKYLHCHHKDMIKSNCKPNNLICLCVICHAESPSHSHIKSLRQYRDYMALLDS